MWERGLKLSHYLCDVRVGHVAPHVGAWIETACSAIRWRYRGSLPMWERGLKQEEFDEKQGGEHVAPHVGAWIETYFGMSLSLIISRRSPCGSVD